LKTFFLLLVQYPGRQKAMYTSLDAQSPGGLSHGSEVRYEGTMKKEGTGPANRKDH
jgi:hypothetical protein